MIHGKVAVGVGGWDEVVQEVGRERTETPGGRRVKKQGLNKGVSWRKREIDSLAAGQGITEGKEGGKEKQRHSLKVK